MYVSIDSRNIYSEDLTMLECGSEINKKNNNYLEGHPPLDGGLVVVCSLLRGYFLIVRALLSELHGDPGPWGGHKGRGPTLVDPLLPLGILR